jgi:hypothetical protein
MNRRKVSEIQITETCNKHTQVFRSADILIESEVYTVNKLMKHTNK